LNFVLKIGRGLLHLAERYSTKLSSIFVGAT